MVSETPHPVTTDRGPVVGPEAVVNARIAESDRLLRQIRSQIAARVPLVAWPLLWRVALLRALTPAPDENLNPAEWRKIEAVRFWIRVDEGACDRGALEGRGALDGDSRDLAYLVDRLRADLASGWERPQKVL
ncbi:MAG: hypothetical protein M0Z85_01135 [Gammaproteobacteria bacterium]|jgi:hypothetical protein|nr:hypothetical protein [Gammaproteobacteria bacterium]